MRRTLKQEARQRKPASAPPDNFVAYFFDDVHIKVEDLIRVRDAAGKNIDTLQSTDRAAIFAAAAGAGAAADSGAPDRRFQATH